MGKYYEFISKYLQSVFPYEDLVKIDVEIMKWESFTDKESKTILHARYNVTLWSLVGGIVIVLWYHHAHSAINNQNISA